MILLALLAAVAPRCALPDFCPSDSELKAAVAARADATAWADMQAARETNPDEIVLISPLRILSLSNVYCGELVSDDPKAIACRYTVRYPSGFSYEVARLVRGKQGWTIEDEMSVFRYTRDRDRR